MLPKKRPKAKDKPGEVPASEISKDEAAKLIKCKASEILSARDYADHVVVVTLDGKKLRGDKK